MLKPEIEAGLIDFEARYAAWRESLKSQSQDVDVAIGGMEQAIPQSTLPKWECPHCGESVRVGKRGDLNILCGPCTKETMTEVYYVRSVNVRQYNRKSKDS